MGHLFAVLALAALATAAFTMAFFPRVLPNLTNSYYSFIEMKTRVSVEDYATVSVRLSGFFIFAVEIVWLLYRMHLGRAL